MIKEGSLYYLSKAVGQVSPLVAELGAACDAFHLVVGREELENKQDSNTVLCT